MRHDPDSKEGCLTFTESSDRELILACLKHDPAGWEALLNRYKRLIYSATLRFRLDSEECREVFQIVCLELLKSLPSLREMDKLRSWILTITIRECNDFIRRKYRDRDLFSGDFSVVRQDRVDTLSVYASLERQENLRLAMERLSDQCRRLLRMLFLEDDKSTYVAAAQRLGISKDSIGSARQRCLDRLRKLLDKDAL